MGVGTGVGSGVPALRIWNPLLYGLLGYCETQSLDRSSAVCFLVTEGVYPQDFDPIIESIGPPLLPGLMAASV